jgi:DNA-binding transcriptional ArsR family regulator
LPVGKLAEGLPISRPAVSQHLRVLRRAGLVREQAAGTRRIYAVLPTGLAELRAYLNEFWGDALGRLKEATEWQEERDARIADVARGRIEPVRKSIYVAVPPERAFVLFTERMDACWPFQGHSIFGARASTVEFERRVAGRMHEVSLDGECGRWGQLLAWDPPRAFRMTWHPGLERATAQELHVRFIPVHGGTRVEIEQDGFEQLAEQGQSARHGYDQDWADVLASFAAACTGGAR